MVQATTPTFVLTLPNTLDLSTASKVTFTISQDNGNVVINKSDSELDINANVVSVYLSQEETLQFSHFIDAQIQLNWVYLDGSRACSEIKDVVVGENLHKAVF